MDLDDALAMEQGPARTATLAAWFQGLFVDPTAVPILVGDGAVELYTGGAYVTGDLDFVGELTEAVAQALREAGFRRIGRHWKHDEGELFIELPARSLEAGHRSAELDAFGQIVRVISPEDVLVDRLAGWKFWRSGEHGVNAYLLYRALDAELDRPRLEERAEAEDVRDALMELVRFANEVENREPTQEELEQWAKRSR